MKVLILTTRPLNMHPVAEALHMKIYENRNPTFDEEDIIAIFECSSAMKIDYSAYDWTANIGPCIHGRHHFDITLQATGSDIEYELSEAIALAAEVVDEEDDIGEHE